MLLFPVHSFFVINRLGCYFYKPRHTFHNTNIYYSTKWAEQTTMTTNTISETSTLPHIQRTRLQCSINWWASHMGKISLTCHSWISFATTPLTIYRSALSQRCLIWKKYTSRSAVLPSAYISRQFRYRLLREKSSCRQPQDMQNLSHWAVGSLAPPGIAGMSTSLKWVSASRAASTSSTSCRGCLIVTSAASRTIWINKSGRRPSTSMYLCCRGAAPHSCLLPHSPWQPHECMPSSSLWRWAICTGLASWRPSKSSSEIILFIICCICANLAAKFITQSQKQCRWQFTMWTLSWEMNMTHMILLVLAAATSHPRIISPISALHCREDGIPLRFFCIFGEQHARSQASVPFCSSGEIVNFWSTIPEVIYPAELQTCGTPAMDDKTELRAGPDCCEFTYTATVWMRNIIWILLLKLGQQIRINNVPNICLYIAV